jgi:predicted RNA-binding Zn ribbon-like protein
MQGSVTIRSVPEPAVEFANTLRASRGQLTDGLPEWADQAGLQADLAQVTELRDAIRVLLRAVTEGGEIPAAELGVLNSAAATAPQWPELQAGLTVMAQTAAHARQAALAAIARDAIDLLGTPARRDTLRACEGPGCVQFFMRDHPRREWCGPACGNRARAARHYARHRAG